MKSKKMPNIRFIDYMEEIAKWTKEELRTILVDTMPPIHTEKEHNWNTDCDPVSDVLTFKKQVEESVGYVPIINIDYSGQIHDSQIYTIHTSPWAKDITPNSTISEKLKSTMLKMIEFDMERREKAAMEILCHGAFNSNFLKNDPPTTGGNVMKEEKKKEPESRNLQVFIPKSLTTGVENRILIAHGSKIHLDSKSISLILENVGSCIVEAIPKTVNEKTDYFSVRITDSQGQIGLGHCIRGGNDVASWPNGNISAKAIFGLRLAGTLCVDRAIRAFMKKKSTDKVRRDYSQFPKDWTRKQMEIVMSAPFDFLSEWIG